MTSTEKLGLRRGEYAGAETTLVFSDAGDEFKALRAGCGVYDLGWRRYFQIAGRDRVRWLNGMVSNNVRDLAPGHGVYAFVLTPQGHMVGDLYAYNRGKDFVMATDARQAEKLYSHLKRFIIMDQVEFKPAEDWAAIAVQGPKAEETLRAAGIGVSAMEPLQQTSARCGTIEATLVRGDHPLSPDYELWSTPQQAAALWDALVKAGATPVGAEAVELARIAAGVPRFGQDIRERDLPQETGQARALSFTKGCYIGQEIVERIRARGSLHRGFTGFRIVEGSLPAPGSKVEARGKEVGEITSVAMLPASSGVIPVALGYMRKEAGAAGAMVEVGASRARVESLPFSI